MKKLQIEELKITSFVTGEKKKVTGGVVTGMTCGHLYTCALYCSDTRGDVPCKDTPNYTAYHC